MRSEKQAEEDLMARAAVAAEELYEVRDSFFPADPAEKDSRLRALADAALRLFDAVPEGGPPQFYDSNRGFLLHFSCLH